MIIERKIVDQERGIIQITTSDSRWYLVQEEGKPERFMPSVTWITSTGIPKGRGYEKWLADKGIEQAEEIKIAAGDKGSRVHSAISNILLGKSVKYNDTYSGSEGGEPEELTAVEYEAIMSFVNWLNETQPEVIAIDYTLVNEQEGYAGTIDMKLKIGGEVWIVDIKTSKDVYLSHRAQVSAYMAADPECQKIAILQVGYARNKNKYKFTEIEPCYPVFLAAKEIWAQENKDVQPQQKDFPLELKWKKAIEDKKVVK